YNDESEGLGFEFAAEVRKTLTRILEYPEAWPSLTKRTRRCRMLRFPYGIIYQVRGEILLIVAVMHLHRLPGYWRLRR
ncbi:MAG: type II toxin-antitoxin system RelE/ParE family toxin, partial [Candidatus Rokubacteria bacterium]|nr:type II toxin-antitoxin system RelE/ParE family toxin [Candidatus Rokubacteria bacterium]